jgi:ribonucleotide monophosphatase NagD (HAD superfamily)
MAAPIRRTSRRLAALRWAQALEEPDIPTSTPSESGADAVHVAWHPDCSMKVTGIDAEVTGKPSLQALDFVSWRLGVPRESLVVIGDDPRVEIEMARAGGAIGVGVTTGTSRDAWLTQAEARRPHYVMDGLDELDSLGLFSR